MLGTERKNEKIAEIASLKENKRPKPFITSDDIENHYKLIRCKITLLFAVMNVDFHFYRKLGVLEVVMFISTTFLLELRNLEKNCNEKLRQMEETNVEPQH